MSGPFGKASGRTFHPISTPFPDTPSTSLWVPSSRSLKMSNQPPSEALSESTRTEKSGLPMSVFATRRLDIGELSFGHESKVSYDLLKGMGSTQLKKQYDRKLTPRA